ncbi:MULTISPECIES: BON domain-containing protein [Crateriforma]|uniref:BON domain protein n=1 Tax=Crateriforma conspicua TaxID=2527996 RepID=A0A5C6FRD9_9PLAN|nr:MULTISPECIES: BON domain-containing protein [Crateriforma]TWU65732.1 BON domain protein [Crateriforma conspicua]
MNQNNETELAVAALAALAESSVSELRFLRVDESENSLHLTGRVKSFYHKQLAQELVRPLADGRQVVNHVNVCHQPMSAAS